MDFINQAKGGGLSTSSRCPLRGNKVTQDYGLNLRKSFVLALMALVYHPVSANAQQAYPIVVPCGENDCIMTSEMARRLQAQADSLRAILECPKDVEWPPLPMEGRRVVHTGKPDRDDVTVPQYAYFYSPGISEKAACLPVVIVQAQGSTFGWVSVLDSPPALGGAFEQFFDLLGTERPR